MGNSGRAILHLLLRFLQFGRVELSHLLATRMDSVANPFPLLFSSLGPFGSIVERVRCISSLAVSIIIGNIFSAVLKFCFAVGAVRASSTRAACSFPGHSNQVGFGGLKTNGKAIFVHTLIFFAFYAILFLIGFTVRYENSRSKLIDMSVKKQLEDIVAQLDLGHITLVA